MCSSGYSISEKSQTDAYRIVENEFDALESSDSKINKIGNQIILEYQNEKQESLIEIIHVIKNPDMDIDKVTQTFSKYLRLKIVENAAILQISSESKNLGQITKQWIDANQSIIVKLVAESSVKIPERLTKHIDKICTPTRLNREKSAINGIFHRIFNAKYTLGLCEILPIIIEEEMNDYSSVVEVFINYLNLKIVEIGITDRHFLYIQDKYYRTDWVMALRSFKILNTDKFIQKLEDIGYAEDIQREILKPYISWENWMKTLPNDRITEIIQQVCSEMFIEENLVKIIPPILLKLHDYEMIVTIFCRYLISKIVKLASENMKELKNRNYSLYLYEIHRISSQVPSYVSSNIDGIKASLTKVGINPSPLHADSTCAIL